MRAAVYQAAGTVTVEDVPDAALAEPTDAVVRVLASCICGSDLWSYRGVINRAARLPASATSSSASSRRSAPRSRTVRAGDLVVAPFMWSDNTCPACRGRHADARCDNGGTFGAPGTDGGQGEAVRVPQADGTLVAVPGGPDGVDERCCPRCWRCPT